MPPVIEVVFHDLFDMLGEGTIVIQFSHCPEEQIKSVRLIIIFIEIIKLLYHFAEIIHKERSHHNSEEHNKRAQNPFTILFWVKVPQAHRGKSGEGEIGERGDYFNI